MVMIYALTCRKNGKAYIGSTRASLSKRMREHRCLLNAGKHKTPLLQHDWSRYGADEFRMSVLLAMPPGASLEERRGAEIYWMNLYDLKGLLYNEHRISMQPTWAAIEKGIEASRHIIGNRWTPEANEKRRQAQLGKPKGHGAKISATKRAKREQVMR